jgi:copper resistance protein D
MARYLACRCGGAALRRQRKKVALFAVMVGLAGVNRFWIVPALGNSAPPDGTLRRLRLHILLEQCLGLAIILVVALLGTMEPAISSMQ